MNRREESIRRELGALARRSEESLLRVRAELHRLEQQQGVGALHAEATRAAVQGGWDVRVETSRWFKSPFTAVDLGPDGRYVAVASSDPNAWDEDDMADPLADGGAIQIWDVAAARPVRTISRITAGVNNVGGSTLRWSPRGDRLAAGFDTNAFGIWAPFEAAAPIEVYPDSGPESGPGLAWRADGQAIACSWYSDPLGAGILELADLPANGTRLTEEALQWPGRGDRFPGSHDFAGLEAFAFLQDGTLLVVDGSLFGRVDLERGVLVSHHARAGQDSCADYADAWEVSAGGRFVALRAGRGAEVRDVITGDQVALFEPPTGYVSAACWSPDGRRLALAHTGGVRVIRPEEPSRAVEVKSSVRQKLGATFASRRPLAWHPDGDHLLVLSRTGLQSWQVGDGDAHEVASLPLVGTVQGIGFGADERAVTWSGKTLSFWELASGARVGGLDVEEGVDPTEGAWPSLRDHPLRAGNEVWQPDAAFTVRRNGRTRWAAAFQTGLVIAPGMELETVAPHVAFVLDGRHGWPLHWGQPSDLLQIVDRWQDAADHARLPAAPAAVRQLLRERP